MSEQKIKITRRVTMIVDPAIMGFTIEVKGERRHYPYGMKHALEYALIHVHGKKNIKNIKKLIKLIEKLPDKEVLT